MSSAFALPNLGIQFLTILVNGIPEQWIQTKHISQSFCFFWKILNNNDLLFVVVEV